MSFRCLYSCLKCTLPIWLSINSPSSSILLPLTFIKLIFFFHHYIPILLQTIIFMTLFSINLWKYIVLPAPIFLCSYFSANIHGRGVQTRTSSHLLAAHSVPGTTLSHLIHWKHCKFSYYFCLVEFVKAPCISMSTSSSSTARRRPKPQCALGSTWGVDAVSGSSRPQEAAGWFHLTPLEIFLS